MNGMMMRNIIHNNYDYFSLMPKMSKYIDDISDSFLILSKGDVFISDEITVAYRRRIEEKGEYNFNSINSGLDLLNKKINLLNNLYTYFGKDYNFINRYSSILAPIIAKNVRINNFKDFKKIIYSIPSEYIDKGVIFKSLLNIPLQTISMLKRRFIE